MELIKSARIDVFGHLHASIERCARKVDELVEIRAEEDLIAAPSLLESALDLDAEFAAPSLKVLATRIALFGSVSIKDAD
jgi:hypothetical protein